ncbi:hypothetical protein ACQB60_06185 [Actinomycetota bacterium Odt1-20B]
MLDADPQTSPCAVYARSARDRVHRGCRERINEHLTELPRLYRNLEDVLQPGRHGGDGRTATRAAPLPRNAAALDLRGSGGIEGVLASWAADLCEREDWPLHRYGNVQAAVDGYAELLRLNLTVICDEHPAVREFAHELRRLVGRARWLLPDEQEPIRFAVCCSTPGCAGVLKVTPAAAGARCNRCSTQYGAEVLKLPLAERSAA